MSRLENLSHIDFEELCRDIARVETRLRFSAFGPGPDGGMDGRHSEGDRKTILQCKHYPRSSFSDLKRAVSREVKKLSKLSPQRYILFTSQSLTPARSDKLAALLGDYLKEPGDIWGQEDIEESLRRHPTVEKSHLKLWLSSTAVLERILQSGLEAYTQATKDEILTELRTYVRNESFDRAAKKLEEHNILVVSGPPGVGKTTLAKMLSYHYLDQGWQYSAIRTLDEGFDRINDEVPTVFFFDDFLGRIQLDQQSLLQRESAFGTFVRRIRESKNARFILTTRAHIFEEARQLSDYVDDKRLQLAKYVLDVGSYTRKIKSYILFNHLSASNLTVEHFSALLEGDWLKKIIDHKNYSPRVIASASSDSLDKVEPSEYPGYLYHALENPDLVWSKPFRALDIKSQNLLVALFFSSQFGLEIKKLRENFAELHRTICAHYGQPTMPSDFESALKSLESGFVSISGQRVSFVNPSLRDFLKCFLVEQDLLLLLPPTAQRADWAQELWRHARGVFDPHPEIIAAFVQKFLAFAPRIDAKPFMARTKNAQVWDFSIDDLGMSERVNLLLEWWEISADEVFLEKALDLLTSGSIRLLAWNDGQLFPKIHWWVRNFVDDKHPLKSGLLSAIEERLVDAVESGVSVDELIVIIEQVHENMGDSVPDSVENALDAALHYEFFETSDAISHLDSEESLSEHLDNLSALAELTGCDPQSANEVVENRLAEFDERDYGEYRPSFSRSGNGRNEVFSDESIRSLFSNLVR